MDKRPVEIGLDRVAAEKDKDNSQADAPAQPKPEYPLSPDQVAALRTKIIETLKTCYDPELPVNVYELGLIYDIHVESDGKVHIRMTLTTPACPVAGSLVAEIEDKIRRLPEVSTAKVDLVWDPPWDKSRMTEAARLQLGLDDW